MSILVVFAVILFVIFGQWHLEISNFFHFDVTIRTLPSYFWSCTTLFFCKLIYFWYALLLVSFAMSNVTWGMRVFMLFQWKIFSVHGLSLLPFTFSISTYFSSIFLIQIGWIHSIFLRGNLKGAPHHKRKSTYVPPGMWHYLGYLFRASLNWNFPNLPKDEVFYNKSPIFDLLYIPFFPAWHLSTNFHRVHNFSNIYFRFLVWHVKLSV